MKPNFTKEVDFKALGRRIRTRREARGWTQEQFAEHANRSAAFIGHIERGTRVMSLVTFYEVVRALDCSADELLGLELKSADAYTAAIDLIEMAQTIAKSKTNEKETEKGNKENSQ